MAANGAKLEFRTSVVKKNTEFYKNYVAGKLTDENFKWPECPFKFITKNHLIGAIQSPHRSDIEYVENDGPESPSSSHSASIPSASTSNQLMSDMIKLVKGEKNDVRDESKSEVGAQRAEAPANANPVIIVQYPYGMNPYAMNSTMMSMANIPNLPMLGLPQHTPHQSWGCATPAQNSAATPMHPSSSNPLAIELDNETNHRTRTKIIPLESNFDVEHNDPRPKRQSGPKKIIRLLRTHTTKRFIDTYKRTHRNLTQEGAGRVAHSNPVVKEMHTELVQKRIQTQKELRKTMTADDFHRNQLEDVSLSEAESDSDLSPSYEPVASNDEVLSTTNGVINSELIVPSISSDNDSDLSHGTAEFHPVSKKDTKEKTSRTSKKRRRSRSASKHEKHRSSEKHARSRSSKLEHSRSSGKREKRRGSDKHERSRGGSDHKRDRSRSCDRQENKKKRVAPLLINKRNNTVINKDEIDNCAQNELVVAQTANKENKAPECTSTIVQPVSKEESLSVEDNLEDLFAAPIRTSCDPFQKLNSSLVDLFTSSPARNVEKQIAAEANEIELVEMSEPFSHVMNSVVEHTEPEIEQYENDDAMDDMETLKVSQSPTEMIDDDTQMVKTEGTAGHSDDESDAEVSAIELENINNTVPPNTCQKSNQINPSSNLHCALCTYRRDSVKKLVAHYVNVHPKNEVYVSRMTESSCESVKKATFIGVIGDEAIKSNCPFCDETMSMTAENWITHFTEHTGEFEYRCSKCGLLRTSKTHGKCDDADAITVIEHVIDNGLLRAYMCSYCNYTQLSNSRVKNHIFNEHQIDQINFADLFCVEFVLLRKINLPSTPTNDTAIQEVNEIARELAQQVTGNVVLLSEDSQDSAESRNDETNKKQESHDIPPQETADARKFHIENQHETDNAENETTKSTSGEEGKVAVVETMEKNEVACGSDAPASAMQTVQSPDSKSTTALLAAKEQYYSDRPLEERIQNATFHGTIELSSDEDEEEQEQKNPKLPIVMMSCYSVDTSDEE